MRIKETPWGPARFAYAYLAATAAGLIAVFLGAISYPIIGVSSVCSSTGPGYCQSIWTGLIASLLLFAALFLMAHLVRLGWQWAGWVIALSLCLAQILVETSAIGLVAIILIIPAVAAGLSFAFPDRELPKWLRVTRLCIMGSLLVQFLIWLIILVTDS